MRPAIAVLSLIVTLGFFMASDHIFAEETDNVSNASEYGLPPGWEVFETIENAYGGHDTSIATDLGSLVAIHSAPLNTFDKANAREYFLKLHLTSALYSEELQNSAKLDLGEVDRGKFTGLFSRVKVQEPITADFTIEVFYVEASDSDKVVVFNTPHALIDEVGKMQSEFLYVLSNDLLVLPGE